MDLEGCSFKPRLKVLVLAVAWWSIVIAASYDMTTTHHAESSKKLAIAELRLHYEKDMLFRKWGASQGTAYKLQTDKTSPNPYLSHLPERDILSSDGKKLTIVNPAMSHETTSFNSSNSELRGRLTSLAPINPANAPDAWESNALRAFQKGIKEASDIEQIGGVKYLRFMGPLFIEQSCLVCHAQNGYKLGDVRGGISIITPYEKYEEAQKGEGFVIGLGHLLVWLVGVLGIIWAHLYLARSDCKQKKAMAETERLVFRNMLLGSLSEGVYGVGGDRKLLFINQAALNILGYDEYEVLGKCPHELFHYKYPNGDPYPVCDCPSDISIRDGSTHSGREMLFHKNGTGIPVEINTVPIKQDGKIVGAVVAFRDISQRIRMQEELETLARTDYLTGINNRRSFAKELGQSFSLFKRSGANCSVLMIDIDHFKTINDSYGHPAGDFVLKELSRIMNEEVRNIDVIGRLGGEEFGVILRQTNIDGAWELAERLRCKVMNEVIKLETNEPKYTTIKYTISIGISEFFNNDSSLEDVLSRADKALYEAKDSGRNRVKVYQLANLG